MKAGLYAVILTSLALAGGPKDLPEWMRVHTDCPSQGIENGGVISVQCELKAGPDEAVKPWLDRVEKEGIRVAKGSDGIGVVLKGRHQGYDALVQIREGSSGGSRLKIFATPIGASAPAAAAVHSAGSARPVPHAIEPGPVAALQSASYYGAGPRWTMTNWPTFLPPAPQLRGAWKDTSSGGRQYRTLYNAVDTPEQVRAALDFYAALLPRYGVPVTKTVFEPSKLMRGGSAYLKGELYAENEYIKVSMWFSRSGVWSDSSRPAPFEFRANVTSKVK